MPNLGVCDGVSVCEGYRNARATLSTVDGYVPGLAGSAGIRGFELFSQITELAFLPTVVLDSAAMFHSFIKWLSSLDPKELIYALSATVITTAVAMWLGGIRAAKRRFALRKGLSLYKKSLRQDCLFLTVIGRRQGFSLKETYIQLELAASDLGTNKPDSVNSAMQLPHVIVAGPGAGKSTIVKHRILSHLESSKVLPFFVRLRDYTPDKSIQES